MWLCLNRAFLSIVAPDPGEPDSDLLLVRARRPGDLESVFPGCTVQRTPHRDYLFRALISRTEVARALAQEAAGIDYGNFKASVASRSLHDAFAQVWSVMAGLQPSPPYAGQRRQRHDPPAEE